MTVSNRKKSAAVAPTRAVSGVPRQFRRRLSRLAAKHAAQQAETLRVRELLAAMRKGRRLKIKQGTSHLASHQRPYKKLHGTQARSVIDLDTMPDGSDVPAGCEASFHYTKGLRVVRLRAA